MGKGWGFLAGVLKGDFKCQQAVSMLSVRSQYAVSMQSVRSQYAVSTQSVGSQYAVSKPLLTFIVRLKKASLRPFSEKKISKNKKKINLIKLI